MQGTLSFPNGIGVFVGGILVVELEGSTSRSLVAVGLPKDGTPCFGGFVTWGGPAVEVDAT